MHHACFFGTVTRHTAMTYESLECSKTPLSFILMKMGETLPMLAYMHACVWNFDWHQIYLKLIGNRLDFTVEVWRTLFKCSKMKYLASFFLLNSDLSRKVWIYAYVYFIALANDRWLMVNHSLRTMFGDCRLLY